MLRKRRERERERDRETVREGERAFKFERDENFKE